MPHPIRRSDVILGKFFGYALLLAIFSLLYYTALSALVTVLTGLPLPHRLFPALLFTLQPLILLSVTIYGTTLLPTLANGIAVFMLYTGLYILCFVLAAVGRFNRRDI